MKIAIYARYSSANQNDKSVDDQIAECKRYIKQKYPNNNETLIFLDRALSGRNSLIRPGYNKLKESIRSGELNILVADTLDRISRDGEDTFALYKLCKFNNVVLCTIQDNELNLITIGVKGTMNDQFIENLGHQVRRSQRSRAKEGKMSGLAYGYRIKIKDGREVSGERVIHCDEAEVIQKIFEMYAEGHSLGSIVQILNAKNIPSPRKSKWTKQSLMGNKMRREGILCNDIYRGKVIWNMKSLRINPETGGKNYPMNPEEEWEVTQNDHLRIVSDELWAKCSVRKWQQKPKKKLKPRLINPLRSLVFCGVCDSTKTLADRKRYVCSAFRFHRTCKNARGTQYYKIIENIFEHLFDSLEQTTDKEWSKLTAQLDEGSLTKQELCSKIENISTQISTIVDVISHQTTTIAELANKLADLQHQRSALIVQKNQISIKIKNKDFKHILFTALKKLEANLKKSQINDENRIFLTVLIEKITLSPKAKPIGEDIEILQKSDSWFVFFRLLHDQKHI